MKIRTDFVTNSSSSNYAIIGIGNSTYIEKLRNASGIIEIFCEYGFMSGKCIDFYGTYEDCYYAGLEVEPLMETMNLPQTKQYFVNKIHDELGVDIPIEEVRFYYGECGE